MPRKNDSTGDFSPRQLGFIHVYLNYEDNGPRAVRCEVIRITPGGLRVAIHEIPTLGIRDFHHRNPTIDIELEMPKFNKTVKTRGRLTVLTQNYDTQQPPLFLDLEFLQLTHEEEQALFDSNPRLVVI